ncbi:MAG: SBBP repeat-containing protein [candidate division KSB1 bacterium]|nr:SBBP repeat-containing protein [candidate division KSB1 bacterium]
MKTLTTICLTATLLGATLIIAQDFSEDGRPTKWTPRLGPGFERHFDRVGKHTHSHSVQRPSYSGGVDTAWVRHYASGLIPGDDGATAMAVDGSGNVYVTGYSLGLGIGYDYATVKYNFAGAEQWVARYNGPENSDDKATALAVDASGNVYVTGYSWGSGTRYNYATVKYNFIGVEQWVVHYNGPGNDDDGASALAVDGSGNVYVTGESEGSGSEYDYATVKYNFAGVEQWVTRYNGPGNDWDLATALAVDGSGNVYVTGRSLGLDIGPDYATVKYNSAGVEQWVTRYNGPESLWGGATALTVDSSGNVYVTGGNIGLGTGYDYATLKYNSAGAEQWLARYNGPGNVWDIATALTVDSSGNVYVTGYSWGSGTGYDYATVKYNSAGIQQWVACYNGPENSGDYATDLALDASGNVYVTGISVGSGTDYDYATVKYNSAGAEQWVARYNGPGNSDDEAIALAVDGSGNVYVTGSSYGIGWSVYTTIKYLQTSVSVEQKEQDRPNSYQLSQNYPNPFNLTTTIHYAIARPGQVTLKIFNPLGQEVATLVNEVKPAGEYELHWNPGGLPSGVYMYQLQAGEFIETKKLILLK